ncbi:phosphoribosylformylglycinamidine synthase [Helicobacter anseris]|uniref:Phosphoribosylformylglycinamidine synthase subunit PurS n=1 Tax=Helicobacter anseris TaxID=375926 RepID=A0A3D8J802_9HELI|nr:phosphoribosylformylglycinamidine synthase subunit PurS [Helicobacter anseris]RDU72991.1 phosphoribosylformylglycinamidine synthase [Helicobacter anseris]
MKAHILVYLKDGVLNPEAKAIENALKSLDFASVQSVKMSKKITITLAHNDRQKAIKECEKMVQELLANTVIEDYNIEIEE